jgi:hypothetical protein
MGVLQLVGVNVSWKVIPLRLYVQIEREFGADDLGDVSLNFQ